jgi:predicted AAA+ superfamily ATPase
MIISLCFVGTSLTGLTDASADTPAVLVNGARQTGKSTLVQAPEMAGQGRPLLEATFLVQLLRPSSRNIGKRVIQTPKVYLNDSGLLAYLLGATVDRVKTDGNLASMLLENFVVMELRKQTTWSGVQAEVLYWRTASGQEVDMVLEDRAGKIAGINGPTPARCREALAVTTCRCTPFDDCHAHVGY